MTAIMKLDNMAPAISMMEKFGVNKEAAIQEATFALLILNRDDRLRECTKSSILEAVVNAANVGLTLNPAAKEAYLISRRNRKKNVYEACFEPSYIGLANLAMREGIVKSIVTQLVYENDQITIDLADNIRPVIHKPELIASKRGELIGCYSVGTFQDGNRQAEWMDVEQLNKIRDKSESYQAVIAKKIKSCPWTTDTKEMYRKTVIKRFVKYLNKGQSGKLDEAISIDNQDYKAENWQIGKIDGLLRMANLPENEIQSIEAGMHDYSYQQAKDVIQHLEENQLPKSPAYDDRMNQGHLDRAIKEAVNDPRK